jgi:hypothetical protein
MRLRIAAWLALSTVTGCTNDFAAFSVGDAPDAGHAGEAQTASSAVAAASLVSAAATSQPSEPMPSEHLTPAPLLDAGPLSSAHLADAALTGTNPTATQSAPDSGVPILELDAGDTGALALTDAQSSSDAAYPPPTCSVCDSEQVTCFTDCQGVADACILSCTNGGCRKSCQDNRETCDLACSTVCGDCYRDRGCGSSCGPVPN